MKVDHHTGGKWFIHCPKHHRENQLLILEHSCWLSFNLTCKSDIWEAHGILSNLLFKKVIGQKQPREVDKCRNIINDDIV